MSETMFDIVQRGEGSTEVVETPIVEVPETPAVVPAVESTPAESTPAEAELSPEDANTLSEFEKTLDVAPVKGVDEPTPTDVKIPENIRIELETLRSQAEALKNPIVKSISDLINGGGDITTLFVQQGKNYADPTMVSDEEVLSKFMGDLYSETEKDKIPVAIADFKKSNSEDWKFKSAIKEFRDKLSAKYPANVNKAFEEKLGSAVKQVEQSSAERLRNSQSVNQAAQESFTKASTSISQLKEWKFKDLNGKEHSLPLTQTDKDTILKMTSYTTPFEKENGKFNTDKGVETAIKAYLFDKAIVEAKKNGAREYAYAKARINTNGSSAIPGVKSGAGKTILDQIMEADKPKT